MAEQGNKVYQWRQQDGSITNSPDWVDPATGNRYNGQLIQAAADPSLINGFVGGGPGGNIFNANGTPAMVAGSAAISAAPGGNGGGTGVSNLGMGGTYGAAPYGGGGYGPGGGNPYLQGMGEAAIAQNTQNFNRNVLPSISSRSMATGGYGGSRQGVIEATAANDLNTGNANALANLYGNQYNNDQNRNLGYYQATNQLNLGLGGLGYQYADLDRRINNDNQAWQQQGINNGLNILDRLQAGNNTAINSGNAIQQTPINYWNQFSQGANSIGQGYGTSTSSSQNGSNPLLGALGGAQLGGQVANWWNGGNSGWNSMPNNNVYMGTGSMGD